MDYVGGDICEYNMTMAQPGSHNGNPTPTSLTACAAACCADAKCQNFVSPVQLCVLDLTSSP
jgi:uncharacterized OsmC-like protein